jgi:hypothetical protein
LPQLEPLEELFIARVHVSVKVFTVCDASLRETSIANERCSQRIATSSLAASASS